MFPQTNQSLSVALHNRKFLFVLGITIVLIMAIVLWLFSRQTFDVVSINPNPSSINTLTPTIDVSYNQPLRSSRLAVSGSKGLIYKSVVKNRMLSLQLATPLKASKNYFINISVTSQSSATSTTTINFKPIYVTWSQISQNQQNQILSIQSSLEPSLSGLSYLPYEGTDYQLTISNSTSPPSIDFTYVPSYWDTTQGNSAENAAINNAKQWLSQHNLSSYQLINSATNQPI
jgi:hypothetical protein